MSLASSGYQAITERSVSGPGEDVWKARGASTNAAISYGMPNPTGWLGSTYTRNSDPGTLNSALETGLLASPLVKALRTGRLNSSPNNSSEARASAISVPPLSTKSLSAFTPSLPMPPAYSGG